MKLAIFLPVFFGALALFFVVLFVVIAKFKVVERPGPSAPPASPAWHGPQGSSLSGQWNGEILGQGGLGAIGSTLSSTFGVFEVREGLMTFTPEGAVAPDWTTPCQALVVTKKGFLAFDGADVSLSWPTGPDLWRTAQCNISRERINRVMRNDFKDLRERGYADEFIGCLTANGARVNA